MKKTDVANVHISLEGKKNTKLDLCIFGNILIPKIEDVLTKKKQKEILVRKSDFLCRYPWRKPKQNKKMQKLPELGKIWQDLANFPTKAKRHLCSLVNHSRSGQNTVQYAFHPHVGAPRTKREKIQKTGSLQEIVVHCQKVRKSLKKLRILIPPA